MFDIFNMIAVIDVTMIINIHIVQNIVIPFHMVDEACMYYKQLVVVIAKTKVKSLSCFSCVGYSLIHMFTGG